jgi:hypothetical protein
MKKSEKLIAIDDVFLIVFDAIPLNIDSAANLITLY